MKKLNLFIGLSIGLIILSCSNDTDNHQPEQEPENIIKKVLSENITYNYGNFHRTFTYNSNNQVSEINIVYTGNDQWTPDLITYNYSYDNNLIVSATRNDDGQLYYNTEYNYLDNQLIEITNYLPDGNEDSRRELNYNSQEKVSGLNYYVEEELQQVLNFEYNTEGNLTNAEDGTDIYSFQFDQNSSAFEYFSYAEKIIFALDSFHENISENNITSETIIYNANSTNEAVTVLNTEIEYDNDNYPLSKTTIRSQNGNDSANKTIIYEYE